MQDYIARHIHSQILENLHSFPAVALLGPRQCGKTTLASKVVKSHSSAIYLDLEKPSDIRKLQDPELFLASQKGKMICLDEIQRMPDLFTVLRSVIDERNRNGQFLILGSASRDLIRQSSETLAGRICYMELTPLLIKEIVAQAAEKEKLHHYWLSGGFPRSFLAAKDELSYRWRDNFIRTFLERDIPQLGFSIPAAAMGRLWIMLAHLHGQLLNASKLGENLGLSHTTIRSYIDLLSQTFMLRVLPPYIGNVKKRLIKSPKIYLRDSGILHALLEIETFAALMGHPVFGASWEGVVIENILSYFSRCRAGFYRTAAGAEIDLVLTRGSRQVAVECKASSAPQVTRRFFTMLKELQIPHALVVAPVAEAYPIAKNVEVIPLDSAIERLEQWLA